MRHLPSRSSADGKGIETGDGRSKVDRALSNSHTNSTFTFCSIEKLDRAVAEILRVLKPGCHFLTLEHRLSPDPTIQRGERRLNWLQQRLADNCHLDRNIRQLLEQQPFRSVELDEFYLERTPKTHGYLYQGVALK